MAETEFPLDALLGAARRAEPPPLSKLTAERMLQVAVDKSALVPARRRSPWATALPWASVVALAAAALLLAIFQGDPSRLVVEQGGRPLRLSLRTGDALLVGGGSTLEVAEQTAARRAVTLSRGTALFDVAPLRPGERFEVRTPDALIRVVGTVFSVQVEGGRTLVFVHEGKVDVGDTRVVAARAWASAGSVPEGPAPFAADARAAVQARQAASAPAAQVKALRPSVRPQVAAAIDDGGVGAASVTAGERLPVAEARPPAKASAPVGESSSSRLELARGWLRAGDPARALQLLSSGAAQRPMERLLAADALRALGRFSQAATAYQALAADSVDPLRAQAAYGAAELLLRTLKDPAACLRVLDAHQLDDERALLRERASVLRMDALLALGQKAEARRAAQKYLEREPETETSQRVRKRVSGTD